MIVGLPSPYFDDGRIVLYCGDCRDIVPLLPPVDLVLTDPQYQLANGRRANTMGKTVGRNSGRVLKGNALQNRDYGKVQGDDEPFDPAFLLAYPNVILWGAIHYSDKLPNSTRWLVWDKRDGGTSDDNADCEMAWTNIGGPARIFRQLWRGVCRAGEENIATAGNKLHPFQKPAALMRWCLDLVPDAAMTLDPFSGSGTTLRAAKDMGRKAIGIEIEEKYCEVSARRLEQKVLPFMEQ